MCKLPDLTRYREMLATQIGSYGPIEAVGSGSEIDHQLTEYIALNRFLTAHRLHCDECEGRV